MVFSIEKFSSVLCLVRGTNQVRDRLPPECFVLTDHSEAVRTVIHKLCLKFETVFHPLVQKLTEYGRLGDFYSFAEVNLACYVKMSEDPTYFKFMILCSLVETLLATQQCYCAAKVLSVCLIAVYYRCYNELFKKKEEKESLGSYCEELHSRFLNGVEIRFFPISLRLESRVMFTNLRNIDLENFPLKNSEMDMLNDALDLVAQEGNLPEDEVTTTTPCENNSSIHVTLPRNTLLDLSAIVPNLPEDAVTTTTPEENNSFFTGASNAEGAMEDLNSTETLDYSSRASEICYSCNRRCFKYLEVFQKEVVEQILPNE